MQSSSTAKAKELLKQTWLKTRSIATNRTKIELITEDATNLDPWGPTGQQMNGEPPVCSPDSPEAQLPLLLGCSSRKERALGPPQRGAACPMPAACPCGTRVAAAHPPAASCAPPAPAEISDACFDAEKFRQVWGVILRRFESEPAQWRRIYKVGAGCSVGQRAAAACGAADGAQTHPHVERPPSSLICRPCYSRSTC